ncbi:MAG: POTRA domain-containing protein [Bdellovibrionota bacterium]
MSSSAYILFLFLVMSVVARAADPRPSQYYRLPVGEIVSKSFEGQLLEQMKLELGLRVGQTIDRGELDNGLRKLAETGKVQSLFVDIALAKGRLKVTLRGTRLRQIRNIKFLDIDPEIVEEARANLILEEGNVTDLRILTELREQLKKAYERRGFYSAQVKVTVLEQPGQSDADVEIKVLPNEAAYVSKINLIGAPPKQVPRIRDVMEMREGDQFSKGALDRSLAAIKKYLQDNKYYTSKIDQSSLKFSEDRSQVEVNIVLRMGSRIQYAITGNKVFYDVELRELMSEEVLASLNAASNIARLIEAKYQSVGYHFAKVDVEEVQLEKDDTRSVTLKVTEGPQVRIDHVYFNRNKPEIGTVRVLSDDTLERMFYEGAPGVLQRKLFWQKGMSTASSTFQKRIERLGYLNARVSEPKAIFSQDKKGVELFFDIELGSPTRITAIQFENNSRVSNKELWDALPFKVGDAFYPEVLKDGRQRILQYYSRRGYVDAKIIGESRDDVSISRDQESAVIRYEIQEGIQYRVGKVEVEGNRKTESNVILREVRLKTGDVYNPELVAESEEAISLLGLFGRVEVIVSEGDGAATKDLKVVLRELAPGLAEIGFGATYEDPLFRLRAFGGAGYSNLFGKNHSGSLRGEIRLPVSGTSRIFPFLEYAAVLGYVAPHPFELPVILKSALGLDSFQTAFNPIINERTVQTRARFELDVSKQLSDSVTVSYRLYRLERTNTQVYDTNQNQVRPDDIDLIGSTGPGLILDFRNDPFNPTKGSYHLLNLEFAHPALLSNDNISFVMALSRNSFYLPLIGPLSLTAYVGGGYAKSLLSGQPLPEARLASDLSLGGQPSLRGFTINQFKPNNTTRETAFYNLRLEVGAEIFDKFKGVLFVDSGQIFPFPAQAQVRHDGLGVGFRYATPVGPIAVDLAHGIGPDGKTIQFYFSIGTL